MNTKHFLNNEICWISNQFYNIFSHVKWKFSLATQCKSRPSNWWTGHVFKYKFLRLHSINSTTQLVNKTMKSKVHSNYHVSCKDVKKHRRFKISWQIMIMLCLIPVCYKYKAWDHSKCCQIYHYKPKILNERFYHLKTGQANAKLVFYACCGTIKTPFIFLFVLAGIIFYWLV